ncbi:MAG: UMP kinase [Eubacterium sp.]|nr:UMP kinase [Eubacterium sp.]
MAKYKRVLLKLSGEALAGEKGTGFDEATCIPVAKQIKTLTEQGTEVAIVIGGGNFWRGRTSETIDRTKADAIGMMATVMNCIYMSEICRSVGLMTQVLTPCECGSFTKLFSKDRVNKYLGKGMVVFLAGGTGHPYFSTDTATALRAIEIDADVILAAKSIDGVYDSDPAVNPDAKKYDSMKMSDVVNQKLGVMDLAAAVLCMENKMPMYVFGLNEENSIINTVNGAGNGTDITVD